MDQFFGQDFLLANRTGRELYHRVAEDLPVVDYHSHIDPREIALDRVFTNPSQLWLSHDHYKWRLMRAAGVDEAWITGDVDDFGKFEQWAGTLEKAAGNPLYAWTHMELKRFFGYSGQLNGRKAREVWDLCMEKIGSGIPASAFLAQSNVRLLCTTDDPVSDLAWHQKSRTEQGKSFRMLPTFRPDRIAAPEKADYPAYLKELSLVSGIDIGDFDTLRKALEQRMDLFSANGCRISDHGLTDFRFRPWDEAEIDRIIQARREGAAISEEQRQTYVSAVLNFLAASYAKRGWAMQLHLGVSRNVNSAMFERLGADSGFDCIGGGVSWRDVARFLDRLQSENALPRTVLYSIDPKDNAAIDTLIHCFPMPGSPSWVQHGAPWWFNDHREGIRRHLSSLASQGLLGAFIGMLTDSRSLLSYVRHDYFRRILCDYIGGLVEGGEYPGDPELLENLVKDISYRNCLSYFGLEIEESTTVNPIAQGGKHVTD